MAGEFSASFAVAYLIYSDINLTLAHDYLQHAKDAYDFAYNFREIYSVSVRPSGYGSSRYEDELLWASAWMYRATMNASYLANAKTLWDDGLDYTPSGGFQYDDKLAGAQVSVSQRIFQNLTQLILFRFCLQKSRAKLNLHIQTRLPDFVTTFVTTLLVRLQDQYGLPNGGLSALHLQQHLSV